MRRVWIVVVLAVLSSLVVAQGQRGVPDVRYARLAKGVNLPFWFWYGPESQAGIEARYSDDEFETLAAVGVTFVRIPINLPFVHDENAADHLNAANVALLKTQVQRVIDAGLAAIIDIHTTDEDHANFSWWLEHDPAFEAKFVAFWQDFAASMAATFSADDIFFEILNEPIFYDSPEAWPPIQAGLAAAIRTGAPDHTIIAGAARWNSYDTLMDLTPLADPNVIYTFHFYEPFAFTHQGATWSSSDVEPLRNIPYPSSPAIIAPLLSNYTGDAYTTLEDYGNENWNAAKVAGIIANVAAWASTNNVKLLAGEFGVYKAYAPKDDRAELIHDVRTALEANGIGWSMWDYDDSFGLFTRQDPAPPRIDPAIAIALGLDPSAALIAVPYLTATQAGFNDPANPLGPFKIKNVSDGDGAFCGLSGGYYDEQCALVLTGGPTQNVKVKLKWKGDDLKALGAGNGDAIQLIFDLLPATPYTNVTVKLVVTYTNGKAPSVVSNTFTDEVYDHWLHPSLMAPIESKKIDTAKMVIKDHTSGGTVYIDRMNLFLLQPPAGARLLPVPPASK